MSFTENLQKYLIIHYKKNENGMKRLVELQEMMSTIRILRYECEQISEYTCSDSSFLMKKKHVCELISNILNNYYKCRNGKVENINNLEDSIITYDNYMNKINEL